MNTARMQVFHGPGEPFEPRSVPVPSGGELETGSVLVRISLATICGSDLHTIDGRRTAPTPCVLGHEAVGEVIASTRADVAIGQRITWTLADSCGRCQACQRWHLPQKCDRLFKYVHAALTDGSGLNGCYASHIVVRPGTQIFSLPDAISDAVAAPANCALATIASALETLPTPCDRAIVQGAGLLGLYACAWLRERGVTEVFCTDLSPERLALAEAFGATPLRPLASGSDEREDYGGPHRLGADLAGRVDLVVEVAGDPAVIPEGIAALRPGGHYVWAGMVHPESRLDLTGEAVIRKCLTVRGVHNYAPRHLAAALDFLARRHADLPFDRLISPPLPLERIDEALQLARSRRWQRVAIRP